MWKRAIDPVMSLEDPTEHGWREDVQPNWSDEPYPDDMKELFSNDDDATNSDKEDNESKDSDIEISDVE